MVLLKQIDNTNIYEYSIEGAIDKESMSELLNVIENASKNHEKIRLIGRMNEFPKFESFDAFTETAKLKMKAVGNVEKMAIVTDKDWLENFIEFADFMTPNMPLKDFETDEYDEALAWIKQDEVKTFDENEYLTKMDMQHIKGSNIYTFTIDGEIDAAGLKALQEVLEKEKNNGKIKLLVNYVGFDGFDSFSAFINGFKTDFAAIGNVEKYAMLTDKNWIKNILELENKLFSSLNIKVFALDEKEEAMAWLK
jgi:hypothetical protein